MTGRPAWFQIRMRILSLRSLDQLGGDLSTARKVGRNAKALLESKALSWDHTIATLLDN